MKKLAIVGLVFLVLLTGCKTKEERELERLQEESRKAWEDVERLTKEYNDLLDTKNKIDKMQEAINNAR